MSKNSSKAVAKPSPIAPTLEVPDAAPAPHFDLADPDLTFLDVYPENYFSLEGLQVITDEIGGPLALTVSACTVEYVYNPENGEASGSWRPVLAFEETPTLLVLNKTRTKAAVQLTNSPFVKDWAYLGRISIKPAIKDGHAQIVISPAPEEKEKPPKGNGKPLGEMDLDEVNQVLFD